MKKNIEGGVNLRHALITAGSKGLGMKVTEEFLKRGHSVTISYRTDSESVKRLIEKYSYLKDRIQFIQGDVTKVKDLHTMVDAAITRFGRIDFLINNAGPYIFERKKLLDYTDEEWDEMIDGNLSSVFHLCRSVLPYMRKNKFGRVITYGFDGAHHASGWMNRAAYSAAKVGLVSLTKSIALEEAEYGITANMVCPGNIIGTMKESTIEESRHFVDADTPIGRSGTGEDIARTIAFLCEENSDMITGAVIDVTGALKIGNQY